MRTLVVAGAEISGHHPLLGVRMDSTPPHGKITAPRNAIKLRNEILKFLFLTERKDSAEMDCRRAEHKSSFPKLPDRNHLPAPAALASAVQTFLGVGTRRPRFDVPGWRVSRHLKASTIVRGLRAESVSCLSEQAVARSEMSD